MKQFGLSKKERVVNKKEFDRIYKEGTIRKSGKVMVRYLPNDLGYSRLGVAVGKKLFRKASMRNRIKRLVRESFRLNKNLLPKGLDIIIGISGNSTSPLTGSEPRQAGQARPNDRQAGRVSLTQIQTELLKLFSDQVKEKHE
ncbi:MAG: ribonuclease P protein component [Planctomycetota bacterium]